MVHLGMKTQVCTVFLIPFPDQTPLSFAHPSLVAYWRWFCFQEGRSLSASFPLKVNSTGTALWKYLKLNLSQDSHHQPPRVAHVCSWEIACLLIVPVQPCLGKPACSGWKPFVCPQMVYLRWLTALCCYSWVRVNSRWCRETSNK